MRSAATVCRCVHAGLVVLLGGALALGDPKTPKGPTDLPVLQAMQAELARLGQRLAPTVIAVRVKREGSLAESPFTTLPDDKFKSLWSRPISAQGSGVIIRSDGLAITNQHVVQDAIHITVILKGGRRYPATIVGADVRSDLAVIKIDADEKLPAAELGDAGTVRPGHFAIAMGNPFGLANEDGEPAMSWGLVSAVGKVLPHLGMSRDRYYGNLIQTTADINPGHSGGPLFDLKGRVIGINTAMSTHTGKSEGVGFAIPMSRFNKRLIELMTNGRKIEYGYLGIRVDWPDPGHRRRAGVSKGGALVAGVEDGPGKTAGIKPGDIIVRFQQASVDNPDTLIQLIGASPPGSRVRIGLMRDGQALSLTAVVTRRQFRSSVPNPGQTVLWRGLTIAELSDYMKKYLAIDPEIDGVIVLSIAAGSPAARAGIRKGQVIHRVGPTSIAKLREFRSAVADHSGPVTVHIVGQGAKTIRPN